KDAEPPRDVPCAPRRPDEEVASEPGVAGVPGVPSAPVLLASEAPWSGDATEAGAAPPPPPTSLPPPVSTPPTSDASWALVVAAVQALARVMSVKYTSPSGSCE